jgi:DNA-directed RNA polymerase specialized sigma24 family protein
VRALRTGARSAAGWLIGIARNKLLESRRRGRVEDATRRRLGMARIALELECSESVVRQRVSRGLARVRSRLAAKEDGS